jgi:hypothetical protein
VIEITDEERVFGRARCGDSADTKRLRKNSIGLRLWGGAALQRCGEYVAFAAFSLYGKFSVNKNSFSAAS